MVWSGASTVLCLILMFQIFPTDRPASRNNALSEQRTSLKVLSVNLLSSNTNFEEANTLIKSSDPDIVILIEFTSFWEEHIVVRQYPYHIKSTREDHFGIGFYSKYPFEKSELIDFTGSRFPFIHARIMINEKPIEIFGVHFENPVGARANRVRDFQMKESVKFLNALESPKLIIGDFNCSPYSHAFKSLLVDADLYDSRSSFARGGSWPMFFLPLIIPIDHAFVSKEIDIRERSLLKLEGSDHKALFVHLNF